MAGLRTPGYRVLQRALYAYRRMFATMTLGVRAAVIDERGRVLLIRHTYAHGWHFPGGGIEAGETAIDALRRELYEEARVELTDEPRLVGVFQNTTVTERDHEAFYVVRSFRIVEPKGKDLEIAECRFFDQDDLPPDLNSGARRRLQELAEGRPPGEYW